jgi:hypothetical protein
MARGVIGYKIKEHDVLSCSNVARRVPYRINCIKGFAIQL